MRFFQSEATIKFTYPLDRDLELTSQIYAPYYNIQQKMFICTLNMCKN